MAEKRLPVAELHQRCYSYIYGENGYVKNYQQAFKWCSLAAKSNRPSSLTLLAELYTLGNGVDKSLIIAGALYEKAAMQGHLHAQLMVYIVYNYYARGESTEIQKELGKELLKRAKESGYPKAINIYEQVHSQKMSAVKAEL